MQDKLGINSSEWSVLECLWANAPCTLMELVRAMEIEQGWAKSTTNTILSRMLKKGYIKYEEGEKARQYYPCIERTQVVKEETEQLVKKVYGGRIGLLVNTLVSQHGLSKEEIEDLKALLNEVEEE